MITGDEFMTPLEVAEYLHVSRSFVDRLIKNNAIPGYRIFRSWRCRKSELLSWLDEKVIAVSRPALDVQDSKKYRFPEMDRN